MKRFHLEFMGSYLTTHEHLPRFKNSRTKELPEVALVGRSNVGKSSLLNHLAQQKIAFASTKPGKTQTLNFFKVDDRYCFVDLPGYGFANIPEKLKKQWGRYLENYFQNRTSLKMIVLLLDSRRKPTSEDCSIIDFAFFHQIPITLVLTKSDKLNQSEKMQQKKFFAHWCEENYNHINIDSIFYTIKNHEGRIVLLAKIKDIIGEK